MSDKIAIPKSEWTFFYRDPDRPSNHRLFRDQFGYLSAVDLSGDNPTNTDDGPLYLVDVPDAMGRAPVIRGRSGERGSIRLAPAVGRMVAQAFSNHAATRFPSSANWSPPFQERLRLYLAERAHGAPDAVRVAFDSLSAQWSRRQASAEQVAEDLRSLQEVLGGIEALLPKASSEEEDQPGRGTRP